MKKMNTLLVFQRGPIDIPLIVVPQHHLWMNAPCVHTIHHTFSAKLSKKKGFGNNESKPLLCA